MPNTSDPSGKTNAPADTGVAAPRAVTTTTTAATTTTGAQSAATATTAATNVVTLTPASPTTPTAPPYTNSTVAVTVPNTTGTVTFSLVVTDNLGVQSAPAFATVTIQGAPKAALTATPTVLTEGGTIQLSGSGSTSSGSIAKYVFSLVPPTTAAT
ncbi:MAG: hypothetical protein ABR902_13280 [Candidatus Korobacteraceae bacterium]|jgi:hypothetical protein